MTAQESKLSNAYESTITTALTADASSITIAVDAAPTDSSNTAISGAVVMYLVLDPDSDSQREYVKVTNISGTTLTVTRNIDTGGGGLRTHAAGAKIRQTTQAQHFDDIHDRIDKVINEDGSSLNTTTGVVKDEDNMSSNSASHLATQQSIKAYVDSQIQTEETIEDFVGGMVTGNTETFIDVTYEDSDGTMDFVVPVKDEDNMASDSNTHLATQQSIKAYVDTQITAEDLDVTADSGGPISVDLDTDTLDIEGGTGVDTAASANKITVAIDNSVATLTGTQELTNKTINLENNTAIVEYAVTVVNPGSGNKFYIDGQAQATISFRPGVVHRFNLSHSSTSGHPFALSITSNGSHAGGSEYTTGKTSSGVSQGTTGSYVEYTVDAATPDVLYYYCSSHSGMGGKITVFGTPLDGGNGLTISGNDIAVDATVITGQTTEATADNNDVILIYDDTASGLKKQTRAAFLSGTGVGNMNSFTVSADTGSDQTISDANTLEIAGGNGIDTAASATDTVTVTLNAEAVQDIVGAMFSSNTETRISATYDDSDGTIDLVVDDMTTDTQLSTEQVQDIVGAMFTGNTETNITVTYEDSDGTIDLVATGNTTEQIQDIVGAMFTGNTETGITVTYEDSDGTIDLVVAAQDSTAIVDGDSDTKIQVDEGGADEDKIRYDVAGTEVAVQDAGGVALTTNGGIFRHHQTQAATYTVATDEGAVMAGPITITGTVTNNGTMVVI